MKFHVTYKTTLPLLAKSPSAYFLSDNNEELVIEFIDKSTGDLLFSDIATSGKIVSGTRQWFTNWLINFKTKDGKILYQDIFDPTNKVVFVKIDAYALGDNLSWIPYVEEFRKKHNCTIICSTFFNYLFEDEYTDILFVKPNTQIGNVYAQYYIGTFEEMNKSYAPSSHINKPLQKVATDILGLDFKEIKPKIKLPIKQLKDKTVCISERASTPLKEWKGNWQIIVDYLNSLGYKVKVISKESSNLQRVINKTGDINLFDRISDLYDADFFIGVSSGLSWLSWACGTHTFLISDFTPSNHEFSDNCTRIYSENCVKTIKKEENIDSNITEELIISKINTFLGI